MRADAVIRRKAALSSSSFTENKSGGGANNSGNTSHSNKRLSPTTAAPSDHISVDDVSKYGQSFSSEMAHRLHVALSQKRWGYPAAISALLLLLLLSGAIERGRRFVVRRARILGQNDHFVRAWSLIDSESLETLKRAEHYYNQQLPKIKVAARNFHVHAYFASLKRYVTTEKVGWYEMIGYRVKEHARLLASDKRDDYRVEKDKCVMMEFFERNQFPMPKIFKVWRVKSKAIQDLTERPEQILGDTKFPVFLKSCHLTQGSSKGTTPVKSLLELKDSWTWFHRWINAKWQYRSDDWERPWAADMNLLTNTLVPGLLIQGPFEIPKGPGCQFMELKVEVLYGYAYLAISNEPYKGTIITRDGNIEVYPGIRRGITNAAIQNPEETKWVEEEGHLPKVWAMAERAAKIIGADEIRIDIFIRRGDPDGVNINENSLSSGMGSATGRGGEKR